MSSESGTPAVLDGSAVLDASALLALLQDEPGADRVERALTAAAISAVNFSEVWQKLRDRGLDAAPLMAGLLALGLTVVDFGRADAERTARLREVTRTRGLSLADRACLALAGRLHREVLTADRAWADLDLGIAVRLIR